MQIEVKVPSVGESITEVEIGQWLKNEGDQIVNGENLVVIESEKTTLELPAPAEGELVKILKSKGQTANIGEVIAYLDTTSVGTPRREGVGKESPKAAGTPAPPAPTEGKGTEQRIMPAAARVIAEHGLKAEEIQGSGPGGRILKEDVLRHVETLQKDKSAAPAPAASTQAPGARETQPAPPAPFPVMPAGAESDSPLDVPTAFRQEQAVPMSRLRRTVAERLVQAQRTAALLTTFNEIDMSEVMRLRKSYQEEFTAKYGIKLGFMSFFVKAVIDALRLVPQVNSEVRENEIIYRNYYDIGVAIGGGRGLVVPVLRNAERMSFAQIEMAIAEFAKRAKENKLKLEDLQGGTFTISNGGVYGSLLSTPIVNPPQSGILGMHSIQERPIAKEGQVVIRPMMYIALTYDHRIVDGREAVTFLKRIKDVIENPARLFLEV